MKDCTTCKWDHEYNQISDNLCKQGHIRHTLSSMGNITPIENCHAWQEKERCECYRADEYLDNWVRDPINKICTLKFICKKCGRIIE